MPKAKKPAPVSIEWLNDTDWVYPPLQERSRKALQKILTNAKALFVANGFDETTITEISRKSRISVGSIYNRFPDKISILYAILESYKRTRFAQIEDLIRSDLWIDKGPLDVLTFHIEIIFSSARRDTGLTRMIERQRIVNPVVRDMQLEWNDHICSVIAGLYQPHARAIKKPDIEKAVRYIHNIIRGSLLWAILPTEQGNHVLNLNSEEYQQEAFSLAAAYLGLKP